MSVKTQINRIKTAVGAAYDAVGTKGGTVPTSETVAGLAAAISSIPSGSSLDSVWPVGSIYMSVNSTSPSTLFGGTWARITNKFLLAAGSASDTLAGYSTAPGQTGGEETHTLTEGELAKHRHGNIAHSSSGSNYSGYGANLSFEYSSSLYGYAGYSMYSSGGGAHNNMPPYLAVYVWKRTA